MILTKMTKIVLRMSRFKPILSDRFSNNDSRESNIKNKLIKFDVLHIHIHIINFNFNILF